MGLEPFLIPFLPSSASHERGRILSAEDPKMTVISHSHSGGHGEGGDPGRTWYLPLKFSEKEKKMFRKVRVASSLHNIGMRLPASSFQRSRTSPYSTAFLNLCTHTTNPTTETKTGTLRNLQTYRAGNDGENAQCSSVLQNKGTNSQRHKRKRKARAMAVLQQDGFGGLLLSQLVSTSGKQERGTFLGGQGRQDGL